MRTCKQCGRQVRWSHIWDSYWTWLHVDEPMGHVAVVENGR